jgi:Pyruvate/2-oxoacid:ferredoxin oxidoreductase gamma subunit
LGAFAKATGLVALAALQQAIDEYLTAQQAQNKAAAEAAYKRVVKG